MEFCEICDNMLYVKSNDKNPEHSFAFKSIHTLEQVEVIVKKVEWNVSKDMYMKPIVMFNEIELDDVKIKQATGFNGAYIEKNVIGPGSRIIIIRSGNVIPHIQNVLTPYANGTPSMPGTGIEGVDYKWNDTRVDIMMINKSGDVNRDYDIKNKDIVIAINTNISGKSFVFTGFRDKDLETYISNMGGFIKTIISKKTDYLVVADLNDNSNKVDRARSLGIPIILRDNSIFT